MSEVSQEEKVILLKQAYREQWTTFQILDLWLPLGFKDRADMLRNIEALYNDRLTVVSHISDTQIYLYWCEYQAVCIDGGLEAVRQVNKDNVFRRMLAI